jgi:hypothetical protein
MASFNKFNTFVSDLFNKVHNLGSGGDTLKIGLTNTSPNAADTIYDDAGHTLKATSSAAEVAAGNGYSAGGMTVASTANVNSAGTVKETGNAVVLTASGGTVGPFRYAFLYNASAGTSGNRPLIGWWDYGSSLTLNSGDSFTVAKDTSGGNWDSTTPLLTDA